MNIEQLQHYCLSKKGVEETLPFGPDVLVYKVMGKMFLLCPLDTEGLQFNVKCDPDYAVELREQYPTVIPGYHMSKKHWNTIIDDGSVPLKKLTEWIDHSYDLVVESLSKKTKELLLKNN
ncbi:MAG: MmcQ/YjbR family DNA-binding protein [Chitinophagaceae bacterium]